MPVIRSKTLHQNQASRRSLLQLGKAENTMRDLLDSVDIRVGGSRPCDIQVHDDRFYRRILSNGSLGLGESYMEGWWDCEDLSELIVRILKHDLEKSVVMSLPLLWEVLVAKLVNLQSRRRAPLIGRKHYDQTLKAYLSMTGEFPALSCGYWKNAASLDEAQHAKMDIICRKLSLDSGHHVLDIGCGFGSFAKFAAENYGCQVTGINISPQQAEQARAHCNGLPVSIITCDYRDVDAYFTDQKFDRLVSVGMFEHVGFKNYRHYFEIANRCLADNGLFLLHTIGSNVSRTHNDPWYDKYIFPNGLLPSIQQIGAAIEQTFVMEDWHNFGFDYYRTLVSWRQNFEQAFDGDRDGEFYRMWTYYLCSAAAMFKSRRSQLWQIVLSNDGLEGGYISVR